MCQFFFHKKVSILLLHLPFLSLINLPVYSNLRYFDVKLAKHSQFYTLRLTSSLKLKFSFLGRIVLVFFVCFLAFFSFEAFLLQIYNFNL